MDPNTNPCTPTRANHIQRQMQGDDPTTKNEGHTGIKVTDGQEGIDNKGTGINTKNNHPTAEAGGGENPTYEGTRDNDQSPYPVPHMNPETFTDQHNTDPASFSHADNRISQGTFGQKWGDSDSLQRTLLPSTQHTDYWEDHREENNSNNNNNSFDHTMWDPTRGPTVVPTPHRGHDHITTEFRGAPESGIQHAPHTSEVIPPTIEAKTSAIIMPSRIYGTTSPDDPPGLNRARGAGTTTPLPFFPPSESLNTQSGHSVEGPLISSSPGAPTWGLPSDISPIPRQERMDGGDLISGNWQGDSLPLSSSSSFMGSTQSQPLYHMGMNRIHYSPKFDIEPHDHPSSCEGDVEHDLDHSQDESHSQRLLEKPGFRVTGRPPLSTPPRVLPSNHLLSQQGHKHDPIPHVIPEPSKQKLGAFPRPYHTETFQEGTYTSIHMWDGAQCFHTLLGMKTPDLHLPSTFPY